MLDIACPIDSFLITWELSFYLPLPGLSSIPSPLVYLIWFDWNRDSLQSFSSRIQSLVIWTHWHLWIWYTSIGNFDILSFDLSCWSRRCLNRLWRNQCGSRTLHHRVWRIPLEWCCVHRKFLILANSTMYLSYVAWIVFDWSYSSFDFLMLAVNLICVLLSHQLTSPDLTFVTFVSHLGTLQYV